MFMLIVNQDGVSFCNTLLKITLWRPYEQNEYKEYIQYEEHISET